MALTSNAEIRLTGGINEADAYFLFRVANDAALETRITTLKGRAVSWLKLHAPTYYTGSATTDTDIDELFKGAEECLTMHYLTMPLKARKVYGTHAPYDSEGSERYQELIDVEWVEQVNGLVGWLLETDSDLGDDDISFAMPQFGATDAILPSEVQSVTDDLRDLISVVEDVPGQTTSVVEL